ncbi:hypothetical protein GRW07_24655, partial [Escherichia coli]|nr:hypothetical protein [Escherichia coli]
MGVVFKMFQNDVKQPLSWEEFHGPNLGYVLELYDQYVQDPTSVDEDLR